MRVIYNYTAQLKKPGGKFVDVSSQVVIEVSDEVRPETSKDIADEKAKIEVLQDRESGVEILDLKIEDGGEIVENDQGQEIERMTLEHEF